MQPRESPHTGVPVSSSNQGETVSCVLPKNESGILQQKQRSVSESCESVPDKVPAVAKKEQDISNQRQNPDSGNPSMAYVGESEILDSGNHAAISNQVSVIPKKELSDGGHCASVSSKKALPGGENPASQFNQVLVLPKEEFDSLEQNSSTATNSHTATADEKLIPETEICTSPFNQVSIVAKIDPINPDHGKNTDSEKNSSVLNKGGGNDPIVLEKSLQHTPSTNLHVCTSLSDQERTAYSTRPEKILHKLQPRRNPDSEIHTSQSAQGSNSPRIHEKALDDGYNWRKYGQKLVKGNVFVRSYYKCTYSNCLVKKQVERSHDGQLTDIKYIGKHEHPKLQGTPQSIGFVSPPDVSKADMPLVATPEAKDYPPVTSRDTSQPIEPAETPRELTATVNNNSTGGADPQLHNSSDDVDNNGPSSKRQRKETGNINDNQVQKTFCESRQVVMMMSEVDIVNDGYRWRKYGQKLVKGNPNPRSYYRCSNAGCKAKKHVERSSHDPKVVITTYEGEHDHDMPASRTVGRSTAESGINRTTMNGEARSELGEHKPVGMDMIVNIGAN